MSQSKAQIQELLKTASTEPRHRFGQNFMIDQNLVRLIAATADVQAGELLIEVGPGTGTLTEELLATPAAGVLAVEIDRHLAPMLLERHVGDPRFSLIEGDALSGKHDLNESLLKAIKAHQAHGGAVKLVANLPYQIASPLVIDLMIAQVQMLVFTVQKEVAIRLKSVNGSEYGPLSVMANLLSEVHVLRTLPPQAFWPAPKIDSALVKMTRRDQLGDDAKRFGEFIRSIFTFRRKTLRNALQMAGLPIEALATAGLEEKSRPDEIAPTGYLRLFKCIKAADGTA